ncbi:hypothetical protein [Phenylobacterium sp.]|uniref:hypothetical protein n=1 Tax=Phenylobacterium sp. TaxID=1871053 RepID=UPI00286B7384|nr:hypothetical protein [Phenylobacterium sp.]
MHLAALALCLALGSSAAAATPTGAASPTEVVAMVSGVPITLQDLRQEYEVMGAREGDAKVRDQALGRIIARRLMAAKARERGLDKSPIFLSSLRRGEESLLEQGYQSSIAEAVAAPSATEVQAYVAAHPEKFAQRRIMLINQVVATPANSDFERFKPLNTLAEIKHLFDVEKTPYQEGVATLDTLTASPQLLKSTAALPENEVFVVQGQAKSMIFNQIAKSTATPLVGSAATTYAEGALRQERTQEAVRAAVDALGKAATIRYSAGYEPAAAERPK